MRSKKLPANAGKIACADLFALRDDFSLGAARLGRFLDQRGIHVIQCQLGLFGWPEGRGESGRLVRKLPALDAGIWAASLRASRQGKISCPAVFGLARRHAITLREAADAVETVGLKVQRCTWGCF